jgi:hypothetical protein
MKRVFIVGAILAFATASMSAQTLEDLNIQIHGYATQGFLYTTNDNILTTTSSNGSPDWTEAVVNVSAVPIPKLRVAVQARYELLGNYSNEITLDYASADYKANDLFGVRFGKVKIPSGLFNEIQDIDPSYLWSLLPQSVYPISSRNGQLSEYGGVVYGTLTLPSKAGKLEYRGWGGESVLAGNDGEFLSFQEEGIAIKGLTAVENGAALHWRTPLPGLMVGASDTKKAAQVGPLTLNNGATAGTNTILPLNEPSYFARYEKDKLMVAAEYMESRGRYTFQVTGAPPVVPGNYDIHDIYGMVSYKLTDKLTAGVYDSQSVDHRMPLGLARYSKDWAISGRYDFNQYLYAKAEEHFVEGTALSYDADLNPGGLKPNTKLTVLKVGVSF